MTEFTVEKAENCFAESQTYMYGLPLRTDRAMLDLLKHELPEGNLRIKENTRRPFFFFEYSGIQIKGALKDDRIKASFPNEDYQNGKASFEKVLKAVLGEMNERV